MSAFVALYAGETVMESELIGLTDDPAVVARVASDLLSQRSKSARGRLLEAKAEADRKVLHLIQCKAEQETKR